MSLRESYKPLYDALDRKSLEKVGAFSAAFMQAKTLGNSIAMSSLIKEAMAALSSDPESIDSFLGVINFATKYGTPLEKTAAAKLELVFKQAVKDEHEKVGSWLTPERGIALAGLGVASAPLIQHISQKVSTNKKIKNSLRQIMADHPELRDNPDTTRYFQAIVDFSPKVASNPLVAGNVLKQMHQIGPGAVTPSLLKDLQSIDKDYSDIEKNRQQLYGGIGPSLMGLSSGGKKSS